MVSSWYTHNHSVPTGVFYFSLSVKYSIHYMRCSALYYKIDFMLDDFAHCRLVCKCSEHMAKLCYVLIASVQFSRSVVSDSLWHHETQRARPPCLSPTPGVNPDPYASSQWCHPTISSSVVPFSSCPQSLPASGSLPMSHLFTWGGQSIGVSALASGLPMNTQDWSPLGWTGWTSLQST